MVARAGAVRGPAGAPGELPTCCDALATVGVPVGTIVEELLFAVAIAAAAQPSANRNAAVVRAAIEIWNRLVSTARSRGAWSREPLAERGVVDMDEAPRLYRALS